MMQLKARPLPITLNDSIFHAFMEKVEYADIATRQNAAVFYAGKENRRIAEKFACMHNKQTLEMTPFGAWLMQQPLYTVLPTVYADRIWERLAQRFAENASGTVVVFVKGSTPECGFSKVQFPALLVNDRVNNVISGGE